MSWGTCRQLFGSAIRLPVWYEILEVRLTVNAPFSYSSPEVETFRSCFQQLLNWRKEESIIAQVHSQIMLQLLSILLGLVVREKVFPGMVAVIFCQPLSKDGSYSSVPMIPQTTLYNVLSYTVGQTPCFVVVGRIIASLNALYKSRLVGRAYSQWRCRRRRRRRGYHMAGHKMLIFSGAVFRVGGFGGWRIAGLTRE